MTLAEVIVELARRSVEHEKRARGEVNGCPEACTHFGYSDACRAAVELLLSVPSNPHTKERTMNFGGAIETLKLGGKVRRTGWNGKNMHLYLVGEDDPDHPPYIVMFTAQRAHQAGWVASQPDMLAEDWEVVA